jgi:hypothetical protein
MPNDVIVGQRWSVWTSGCQQWLLAAVTSRKDGRATLKFDCRYGIQGSDGERMADEDTMLTASNLYRFVEG